MVHDEDGVAAVDMSSHPFVQAVEHLMEHLAGHPKDAYFQPLYNDVRQEYRKMLGIPDPVPEHVQEAERVKKEAAKESKKGK